MSSVEQNDIQKMEVDTEYEPEMYYPRNIVIQGDYRRENVFVWSNNEVEQLLELIEYLDRRVTELEQQANLREDKYNES